LPLGGAESNGTLMTDGIIASTLSGSMSTELNRSLNDGRTGREPGGPAEGVTAFCTCPALGGGTLPNSVNVSPSSSASSSSISSSGADANGRRIGTASFKLWRSTGGAENPGCLGGACTTGGGKRLTRKGGGAPDAGEFGRAPGGGRSLEPGRKVSGGGPAATTPAGTFAGCGGGRAEPATGGSPLSLASMSISISRLPDVSDWVGSDPMFHIASASLRASSRSSCPRSFRPSASAASAARFTQTIASA
jgi:hypothetical protein